MRLAPRGAKRGGIPSVVSAFAVPLGRLSAFAGSRPASPGSAHGAGSRYSVVKMRSTTKTPMLWRTKKTSLNKYFPLVKASALFCFSFYVRIYYHAHGPASIPRNNILSAPRRRSFMELTRPCSGCRASLYRRTGRTPQRKNRGSF